MKAIKLNFSPSSNEGIATDVFNNIKQSELQIATTLNEQILYQKILDCHLKEK